ncbi:MAG: XdhC family protein, partial [Pseudomonadota bacterium]
MIETAAPRPAFRLDTNLELLLERARVRDALPMAGRVLATIVATAGSTYRKAGARMLIEADGEWYGLLSGGCFESDLREHAASVRDGGPPRIVEYDMRGDDDLVFGLGAGCEGAMRILLESAGPGSPAAAALEHVAAASAAGRATAVGIVHEGPATLLGTRAWPGAPATDPALAAACEDALALGASRSLRWNDETTPTEAWVQYLAPPPTLLVCGAGPDAVPVVRQARALGWPVTVVDHRPAYAREDRIPGATVLRVDPAELARTLPLPAFAAAVVMSHHLPSDAAYLRALAATATPGYVGLLGPRPRRERLLSELGTLASGLEGRLRGPVGLDLGAAPPEATARALAAELHAWVAGRPGGPCTP